MKIAAVHPVERIPGMSECISLSFVNGKVVDNDVIRVEGTGENLLARDLGGGRMIFIRGFGCVPASPVAAGDEVIVVANVPPLVETVGSIPPRRETGRQTVPGRMTFSVLERSAK